MAIIVLAHGAWSAAWAWKKVRPLMADFVAKVVGDPGER